MNKHTGMVADFRFQMVCPVNMERGYNGSLYLTTMFGFRLSPEQKRNIFTMIVKL